MLKFLTNSELISDAFLKREFIINFSVQTTSQRSMYFKKLFAFFLIISISTISAAQNIAYKEDSVMLRKIYTEVLEEGKAYEDLRSLCKDIGARLSGSVSAEMAVQWGFQKLKSYNFDTVYMQEVMVPH